MELMFVKLLVLSSRSVLNLLNCRKDDVKEEAKKGLRAVQVVDRTTTEDGTNKEFLPAFPDMVSYVAQKVPSLKPNFLSLVGIKFKFCLQIVACTFHIETQLPNSTSKHN